MPWTEYGYRSPKQRGIVSLFQRYELARSVLEKVRVIWTSWYAEALGVGDFYGVKVAPYALGSFKDLLGRRKDVDVFEVVADTYHHRMPEHDKTFIQLASERDLPLLMADEKYQPFIEQRYRHELKPILQRQDLYDRFVRVNIRSNHVHTVLHTYENLITVWVKEQFKPQIYDTWRGFSECLIVVTYRGKPYHFAIAFGGSKDLRMVTDRVLYGTVSEDGTLIKTV